MTRVLQIPETQAIQIRENVGPPPQASRPNQSVIIQDADSRRVLRAFDSLDSITMAACLQESDHARCDAQPRSGAQLMLVIKRTLDNVAADDRKANNEIHK